MDEKKEHRTTDNILDDIIKASKEYDVVLQIMRRLMPDPNTDVYGSEAVFKLLRHRLYTLYKELADRIAFEDRLERMAE